MDKGYVYLSIVGALTGMPPIAAMVVLAPGFHLRLRNVLMITIPCRFIRFTVLAWAGERIFAWWATL